MNHFTFSCPSEKPLTSILGGVLIMMLVGLWPMADARAAEPVAPRLTPKLQKLFAEEMVAILQASQQIVAALVAGDHALVTKNAQAIHDSFILDRNLTAQDRKALETAVPPAFLELDGAFHQMAAKLADAGRHKDTELQNYYFGRMLETCGTCHRQYATDKFPALGGKTPLGHSH
jgi:cytochrome c553